MTGLMTDVDLAEHLRLDTVDELHILRRRYGWPCVKLGRFNIRFTPEQVDQIVRMHTESATSKPAAVEFGGQTLRSARAR